MRRARRTVLPLRAVAGAIAVVFMVFSAILPRFDGEVVETLETDTQVRAAVLAGRRTRLPRPA